MKSIVDGCAWRCLQEIEKVVKTGNGCLEECVYLFVEFNFSLGFRFFILGYFFFWFSNI